MSLLDVSCSAPVAFWLQTRAALPAAAVQRTSRQRNAQLAPRMLHLPRKGSSSGTDIKARGIFCSHGRGCSGDCAGGALEKNVEGESMRYKGAAGAGAALGAPWSRHDKHLHFKNIKMVDVFPEAVGEDGIGYSCVLELPHAVLRSAGRVAPARQIRVQVIRRCN
jgi:hypothetical protein